MGIIKTTKETEEYINSFMENQKESENSGPAVSNYQLSSTVALYKQMLESENGSVCQFASNGGGAPQHGGAMYTQAVVALLCASQNGMGTNIIK